MRGLCPTFFFFFFISRMFQTLQNFFSILIVMEPLTFHVGQCLKMGYITNSPGLWGLLQTLWRHNSWCIWLPLSFQHHFHHWGKKDKIEVGYTQEVDYNLLPSHPTPIPKQKRKKLSKKCTTLIEKDKSCQDQVSSMTYMHNINMVCGPGS